VYAGGALELSTWDGESASPVTKAVLGPDLAAGRPQAVVPAGTRQAACPLAPAPWVLAGCTVSPAFEFRGFELAPAEWEPPARSCSPSLRGFSSTDPHKA
jgi:predicted cupin superfamily sugar epimerase